MFLHAMPCNRGELGRCREGIKGFPLAVSGEIEKTPVHWGAIERFDCNRTSVFFVVGP